MKVALDMQKETFEFRSDSQWKAQLLHPSCSGWMAESVSVSH